MYIIMKQATNGTLSTGSPPTMHPTYQAAEDDARRLLSTVDNAACYYVMKATARVEREQAPVRIVALA